MLGFPFLLYIDNRPYQIYDPEHGKVGITHGGKVGIEDAWTRFSFVPITGRTHQLRVHAAHARGLGIPIVGDPLYGNGTGPGEMKLHAVELGFQHPTSGVEMNFATEPSF